jgi:hypothetical protein
MATIQDILTKLLERTKNNKILWKATAVEDTFVAVIGELSAEVRGDGRTWTELRIRDKEGRTLELLMAGREEHTDMKSLHFGSYWIQELDELLVTARRMALASDRKLSELLHLLDTRP